MILLITADVIRSNFTSWFNLHLMIRIALADGNPTFCQGLKTMLEQVDCFRVIIMPIDSFCLQFANDPSLDILLADEDLLQFCMEKAGGKKQLQPPPGTIILTMDRDELNSPHYGQELLYKGSGKREFEERIRKLARTGGLQ
ncbi:MAG: hypothetical protein NTW31_13020 [Bacteroidetes bacterium]|nr:hypothetical protein [Bacteroidota bacterium]